MYVVSLLVDVKSFDEKVCYKGSKHNVCTASDVQNEAKLVSQTSFSSTFLNGLSSLFRLF